MLMNLKDTKEFLKGTGLLCEVVDVSDFAKDFIHIQSKINKLPGTYIKYPSMNCRVMRFRPSSLDMVDFNYIDALLSYIEFNQTIEFFLCICHRIQLGAVYSVNIP